MENLCFLQNTISTSVLRSSAIMLPGAIYSWINYSNRWTIHATREKPVRVCGLIVPWKFPLMITTFKLAPALTTGNTCILKPAVQTPLSALKLAEFILEPGIPEGVVKVLPDFGESAGDAILRHRGVDKISFTVSTEIGKKILMNGGIKRVTLELGGKNPNIILSDADLDLALG